MVFLNLILKVCGNLTDYKYMYEKLESQNFDLIRQRNEWKEKYKDMKRKFNNMQVNRNYYKRKYESMKLLMKDGGC